MNGGHSARITLTDQRSDRFQVVRFRTVRSWWVDHPTLVGGPSDLDFSNSSDRFQTVNIAVTGTVDRSTMGHGPSACAHNEYVCVEGYK
jgi:hypothetical protein